jgi:hypothetical protein
VHRRCFAPVRAIMLGLPWPPPPVEDDDLEAQSVMPMDFQEEPLAG